MILFDGDWTKRQDAPLWVGWQKMACECEICGRSQTELAVVDDDEWAIKYICRSCYGAEKVARHVIERGEAEREAMAYRITELEKRTGLYDWQAADREA